MPQSACIHIDSLTAIKDSLDASGATVSKSVTGWYVDVATNTVVVEATKAAAAKQFVAAAGVQADAV